MLNKRIKTLKKLNVDHIIDRKLMDTLVSKLRGKGKAHKLFKGYKVLGVNYVKRICETHTDIDIETTASQVIDVVLGQNQGRFEITSKAYKSEIAAKSEIEGGE